MRYKLSIGCHRPGRLMSRDSENIEFDTMEEAEDRIRASEKTWRSIGYQVWFAKITDKKTGEVLLER